MIKKWCMQNQYSILIMLLVLCFGIFNITKSYGFLVFPDEFGYWTYAAMLAGYDWSDIVSLGSYYSYGYSLILFPIFILCKDAVIAYRVAIAVNFILLVCCFFIWKRLFSRLLGRMKDSMVVFWTAIAVFYPSWLFYARTTLAEIAIVTLYAAICMLLYDYLEHNRVSTLIMLVLALVYIHFVHMRTVAILIACAMTLAVYYLVKKKRLKQCLWVVLLLVGVFVIGYCLKEWITGTIYATSEKVNTNDYAGQMGKFTYMFTKEGFINLVISIAGKVLYLGIASFGLAYWGIWYAMKQILQAIKAWKKGREIATAQWFYLFVVLATIGATLVNAIYTIGPGRVDALTYGRYHEYVIPVLMILGIMEIWGGMKLVHGVIVTLLLKIGMTALVTWSLYTYGQTNMHGYMMVGMSYMHDIENFEPIPFYWQALGFAAVLTTLVTFVIRKISKHSHMEIFFALILVMELVLAVRAGNLYLDDSAKGAYRDTKIVEKIEQLNEDEDREIYYLHDGDYALISIVQFMLRDEDIRIVQENSMWYEELEKEDLLLVDYRSPLTEELQEQYEFFMENGHFILYYND